ncbi:hypothetical protein LC087_07340 [Bacillus carboniphilus]|uniref:Uncharacterized protein n=1 Tax=Bacillus carboniphilus TaxID=86663 RepID=A0ABY9JZK1_9BACI|nr:hypothetical protein [Bacillus carboniphilus]WLR43918.1 hypothetical protein LC087_07340 [Bacillus carboniphilus]
MENTLNLILKEIKNLKDTTNIRFDQIDIELCSLTETSQRIENKADELQKKY